MSKKLINGLQKLCKKYGIAQVAAWLKYEDTSAIKKWFTRGIPPKMEGSVQLLISKKK